MIWKGLGVLASAAALVVAGVVGLAWLTVPDVPSFADDLEEASDTGTGSLDFVPNAIGGEIEITGAREGSVTLTEDFSSDGFGLSDSRTKMFLEGNPTQITQMSYDGLAFFPEPEECEFTPGAQNEEVAIVTVQISCPQLTDIRDNGSIAVEGFLALPVIVALDLDIPDLGGTVTVGDESWDIPGGMHFGNYTSPDGETRTGLNLLDEDFSKSVFMAHNPDSGEYTVSEVNYQGASTEVAPDQCTTEAEELAAVSPTQSYWQVTFTCDVVQVAGLGEVPVEGTVVFEQISAPVDH